MNIASHMVQKLKYLHATKTSIVVFGFGVLLAVASVFCPGISYAAIASKVVDCNNDAVINVKDLSIVIANFSKTGKSQVEGDFNGDGKVTVHDVSMMLSYLSNTGTPTTPTGDFSSFWVNPNKQARLEANKIRKARPVDAALLDKIGDQPGSSIVGAYVGDDKDKPPAGTPTPSGGYYLDERTMKTTLAGSQSAKKILLLQIYAIPFRDVGQHSEGGLPDLAAYKKWTDWVASEIKDAHVWIILETDSLAQSPPDELKADRFTALNYAVDKYKSLPNTKVYMDGGAAGWQTPATQAGRLVKAGVGRSDGFFVNVANFQTDTLSINYAENILTEIPKVAVTPKVTKHLKYIVDSGRNGNGKWVPPTSETQAWCNPPGRALGTRPTLNPPDHPHMAAFAWVKNQGGSDGACRGYPKAGVWIESLALEMARNAKW